MEDPKTTTDHKAILEFNLDSAEGIAEFNNAVAGAKLRRVLQEHDEYLRKLLKYHAHEYTSDQQLVIEAIRNQLHAEADDQGVRLSHDYDQSTELAYKPAHGLCKQQVQNKLLLLIAGFAGVLLGIFIEFIDVMFIVNQAAK